MSVVLATTELKAALQRLKPVCSGRVTLPILGSILIKAAGADRLQFTANNLDTWLSVDLRVAAGKFAGVAVPGARLLAACAKIEGDEVELRQEKGRLILASGEWWAKLFALPAEEFPPLESPKEGVEFNIDGTLLGKALRAALHFVSEDATRYVLNGAWWAEKDGALLLAATDGRRLYRAILPCEAPKGLSMIVPAEALSRLLEMCDAGEVQLRVEKPTGTTLLEARAGDWTLRTKLIEGNFPSIEQVIPPAGAKHQWKLSRKQLLAAVPFVEILASGKDRPAVRLTSTAKGAPVLVDCSLPEIGEAHAEIEAEVKGDALTTGFNPTFLRDVLQSFAGDQVTLDMAHATSPVRIEEGNALAVLMPIKLD